MGDFEWACFASHQAAEKAVEALHLSLGQEVWGHIVRRLLEDLAGQVVVPAGLFEQARCLDAYYVPTRYPNGHPDGAPLEHYGEQQSREAITNAEAILEFVRVSMAGGR